MTHWNEEGADWVHVNLGSLKSESVEKLVDEGLFESSKDTDRHPEGREIQGVSWFEEMIEGSKLGRIKQKGDGRSKVEWEVVEFSSEPNTGKRRRESDINGGESSK